MDPFWKLRLFLLPLVFAGYSGSSKSLAEEKAEVVKLEGYDFSFPAMGSTMSFSAYSSSEVRVTQAFEEARSEVERLSAMMTDYVPTSELSRLHGSSQEQRLSDDLFRVLSAAEDWYRISDGGFDVSIGSLTRMWRSARKHDKIPEASEVKQACEHAGWQHVRLDRSARTLRIDDPDVRLDLGGIAVGYIVDRAYEVLLRHGMDRCLINAGGDIRCGRSPPQRPGWKIEVASLKRSGPAFRRVYLSNAAITTSGDLWQYIEIDGIRRSHIVDPRTGYGIPGPTSLTLVATTCLEADAGATALCLMSTNERTKLLSEHPDWAILRLTQKADEPSLDVDESPNFPKAIEEE